MGPEPVLGSERSHRSEQPGPTTRNHPHTATRAALLTKSPREKPAGSDGDPALPETNKEDLKTTKKAVLSPLTEKMGKIWLITPEERKPLQFLA